MTQEHGFFAFQQAFQLLGFEAELQAKTPDHPVEALRLRAWDEQPDEPEVQFQLLFSNDIYAVLAPHEPVTSKEALNLQFLATWAQQIPQNRWQAASELLLALNRLVPLGSFGLQADGSLYFLYVLMSARRELSPALVIHVVRQATFFIQRFRPYLQAVGYEAVSAADAIRRLEQELPQTVT